MNLTPPVQENDTIIAYRVARLQCLYRSIKLETSAEKHQLLHPVHLSLHCWQWCWNAKQIKKVFPFFFTFRMKRGSVANILRIQLKPISSSWEQTLNQTEPTDQHTIVTKHSLSIKDNSSLHQGYKKLCFHNTLSCYFIFIVCFTNVIISPCVVFSFVHSWTGFFFVFLSNCRDGFAWQVSGNPVWGAKKNWLTFHTGLTSHRQITSACVHVT